MIGQQIVKDKDGNYVDNLGRKLSKSAYQPPDEVKKLWARCQRDYQVAYALQHRSFKEFDGYSLLDRARMDQETFAAFVGAEYVPQHKRWRWKGRKNTARNKLIGILAHVLAGMLYPYVNARNQENEDDKMTARVMKILVEDHLKKADYETNFLFMILSALVNPAVFVQVEWVEAMQTIINRQPDGTVNIMKILNEVLSGLALNILPIDEIMLPDFYSGTGKLTTLHCIPRIRRIPWDEARQKWEGKFFDADGKDLFGFVQAGKTRIVLTGNENQELFDIEWTEADLSYVQEITFYYPYEDLEVPFVGGVGMFNYQDVYNNNPFKHRRLTLYKDQWVSVPVLPFVMAGFEPLDPTGRFAYFKSGAFKEFWDDLSLNTMHRLAHDGTYLDIFKPIFLSGVAKADSTVLVPGATVGIPAGAEVTPFNLGPNLKAAYDNIAKMEADMSASTVDNIMQGQETPGVTATQTNQAIQAAKVTFTVFGIFIAKLIREIGELTMDCVVNYATVGELDTSVPGAIDMKFRTFLIKNKEKSRNLTHKIEFTTKHMGKKYTQKQVEGKEWALYNKTGKTPKERMSSDQRIYEINPYQFARTQFSMTIDVDQILDKSIGATKQRKQIAAGILTAPTIAPFTDQQAVADEVIDEFGADLTEDPDKLKKKQNSKPSMMNAVMGNNQPGQNGQPQNGQQNNQIGAGVGAPSNQQMV